jgi:hypothetical protein
MALIMHLGRKHFKNQRKPFTDVEKMSFLLAAENLKNDESTNKCSESLRSKTHL